MRVRAEAPAASTESVPFPTTTTTSSSASTGAQVLSPPSAPAWTPPSWLYKYLAERKLRVDKALDASVPLDGSSHARNLVEAMRYSLLAGGKRVRPILVLAAYDMFSQNKGDDSGAMAAAVAVEMIHTMSLIHDDLPCMDDDDYRRGLPTCHKVYGEDVAVLAGDALLANAFSHLASTPGESSRVVRVLALLGEAVGARGLAGGQVADVEAEGNPDTDLVALNWIHTHKTAVLLRVSVAAGAILAGATDSEVERVSEFATKIGLAFQIADDVLDVTQSTEVLGKTAGKDLAVDKATFPKLLGIERSRQAAQDLVRQADECLTPFGNRANTLRALADFIIKRTN